MVNDISSTIRQLSEPGKPGALEEAVRLYQNPLGIDAKLEAFRSLPDSGLPKAASCLVLQDFRIFTQAEFIFGLRAGDCVSVTIDVTQYRPEYSAQLELLTNQFKPSYVVLAVPKGLECTASHLRSFAISAVGGSVALTKQVEEGLCFVKICLIDESLKEVSFL